MTLRAVVQGKSIKIKRPAIAQRQRRPEGAQPSASRRVYMDGKRLHGDGLRPREAARPATSSRARRS